MSEKEEPLMVRYAKLTKKGKIVFKELERMRKRLQARLEVQKLAQKDREASGRGGGATK